MNRETAIAALADVTTHPWTAGYVLRPIGEDDAHDLLSHFSDPRVTEYLDVDTFSDIADVGRMLDWSESIREGGTGVRWAIRDQDGANNFFGTCGFHRLEYVQGRRGQIGYDLRPEQWGQGVMSEVLPALIEFGHGCLGLRRIEALVTPGNDRSSRLLERHGFRREGVMRDFAFWRGEFQDQILYAKVLRDT
jgi:ribosomal-protein-alanine N-acetyltransferase